MTEGIDLIFVVDFGLSQQVQSYLRWGHLTWALLVKPSKTLQCALIELDDVQATV